MNKSSKAILIILLSILILNFTSAATVSKTVVSEPEQNINSPQAIGIGSYVQVYNTGGTGVLVRSPNACDASIANKPDGAKGTVISSLTYCNSYDRVKVRFEDGLEGWVPLFYLQEIFPSPSFKFNFNDRIYVPSGNVNVRSTPYSSPVLSVLSTQPTNALGTVTTSYFYGVPQSTSGFYYFWYVNFDSGTDGWIAQDYIEKYIPPTQCAPGSGPCCDGSGNFLSSSNICQQDVTTEYGCPWGTSCGQNTGVRHQDRYCSGSSSACDGSLVYDSWSVSDVCNSNEICII